MTVPKFIRIWFGCFLIFACLIESVSGKQPNIVLVMPDGGGIGQTFPGSCGDAPNNTNIDPALWHNGKFKKTKGYCTDLFFNQANQWMNTRRTAGKPFFTYIPLNAAHGPHVVPEEYYRDYVGKPGVNLETAKFFGMLNRAASRKQFPISNENAFPPPSCSAKLAAEIL